MRTRRSLAIALSALLVSAIPLAAQRVVRETDSATTVPAELALALTATWPGSEGASEIVIGGLPDAFPSDLAPPAGGRVLGGATFRRDEGPFGGASVAIIASALAPDAARDATTSRLERAGWEHPRRHEDRGGFVATMRPYPSLFCRGDRMLMAAATPRAGGGSLLRLRLQTTDRGAGRSPCEPEDERRSALRAFDDVPMPALYPPEGSSGNFSSESSGGSSSRTSATRLRTSLSPAQLVSHYAAQLREAGWSLRAPVADELAAVQTGLLTDEEGRTWHGALVALSLPGGREVDLSFRVMRPDAKD